MIKGKRNRVGNSGNKNRAPQAATGLGKVWQRYHRDPVNYANEFATALLPLLSRCASGERKYLGLPEAEEADIVQLLLVQFVSNGFLLKNKALCEASAAGAQKHLVNLVRRHAHDRAIDIYRKRREWRLDSVEAELETEQGRGPTAKTLAIHGASIGGATKLARQELLVELADGLTALALTPLEKRVFGLNHLDGFTQEEIAHRLNCSQSAVCKTLNRIAARARQLGG